ncbi:MAG: pyridoxamine 5'-phosphate oxidase family protein [Solirubrobacteraceae bacterium]
MPAITTDAPSAGMPCSASCDERGDALQLIELSRPECLDLLEAQHFGRLIVGLKGTPVIRPLNYVFDRVSQSVVFRTGPGSKLHALTRAGTATFEIDRFDPALGEGWSVIIRGVITEVTAPGEIERARRLGLNRWPGGPMPHWVRIRAWTVSGRRVVSPRRSIPSAYLG